jgi:hypothetical protein
MYREREIVYSSYNIVTLFWEILSRISENLENVWCEFSEVGWRKQKQMQDFGLVVLT